VVEVRGAWSFSSYETELDINFVRLRVLVVLVDLILVLMNAVTFGGLVRGARGTPAYFRMGKEMTMTPVRASSLKTTPN